MASSEIIADLGDTAVFHHKTVMWSTIDSTQWEPLASIMDDTAQNQIKELWSLSDVNTASSLRAGYQAYLTLWNGSDGEFRHGIYETFLRFENPTIPAGHLLAHTMLSMRIRKNETVQTYGSYNGGVYYGGKPYHQGGTMIQDLLIQRYTAGEGATGQFTSADWYDTEDVSVGNGRGYINDASNFTYNAYLYGGDDRLLQDVITQLGITSGAQLQYVVINSLTNSRTIGTFSRRGPWYYITFYSASAADDPNRFSAPRLILSSLPKSPLVDVLGASIQLSDGSHVYLEKAAGAEVKLMRKPTIAGAAVQIGSLPTGVSEDLFLKDNRSYQTWDLCRDNADNIYVLGSNGATTTKTLARAFKRSVIDTNVWNAGAITTIDPTPLYTSAINNRSCVWVPSSNPSSSGGFVVVTHYHRMGSSSNGTNGQLGQSATLGLDASVLLGDTAGAPLRGISKWDPRSGANPLEPRNAMGTGLDLLPLEEGKIVGISFEQRADLTQNLRDAHMVGRISIDSQGGTTTLATPQADYRGTGFATHDSAGKLRVIDMHSTDTYAVFYGGVLKVLSYNDPATTLASYDFTAASIPGFPSRAALNASAAWDIWYDRAAQTFRLYFIDASNPRRLLRVGYEYLTSALLDGTAPVQLLTNIGPSGGKVNAIRLPRKRIDERWVRLELGILAADNTTESLVTYDETAFNVAPVKPALEDITPFNAADPGTFRWTFDDNNPGDVQSGYELEIKRTSDNVVVYDPGFTAGPTTNGQLPANHTNVEVQVAGGTLTNNTLYQARVRVHDAVGAVSDWSEWKSFATSSTGGLVVIVDPPFDNAPIEGSSTTVDWEFTHSGGAAQTSYRIRVFRTSDNVLLQDTGSVTSAVTQAVVSNLVSGVEQRIEVVVTDSTAEDSAPGIRLVTPNFGNPQAPVIVAVNGDSYIEIRVTNPTPGTDQPQVIRNDIFRRDTGTTDWVRIAQTTVNGVYRDYAVASGKQYDYMVEGVS